MARQGLRAATLAALCLAVAGEGLRAPKPGAAGAAQQPKPGAADAAGRASAAATRAALDEVTANSFDYGRHLNEARQQYADYLDRGPQPWDHVDVLKAQLTLSDPSMKARYARWCVAGRCCWGIRFCRHSRVMSAVLPRAPASWSPCHWCPLCRRATKFLQPQYFQGLDPATGLPGKGKGAPQPPPAEQAGEVDWTAVRMPGGINAEYYLTFMHDYDRYPADMKAAMGARGYLKTLQTPWLQLPVTAPGGGYPGGPRHAYTPAVLPLIPPAAQRGVVAYPGQQHPMTMMQPWADARYQQHAAAAGAGARFTAPGLGAAAAGAPPPLLHPAAGHVFFGSQPPSAYRAKRAQVGQAAGEHAAQNAADAVIAAGIGAGLGYDLHAASGHTLAHAAAMEDAALAHADALRRYSMYDDAGAGP